jgi:DNA topoisomerase I
MLLAIKEVARYLGNTPAVARSSYIDPRVVDRFRGGETILGTLEKLPLDLPDAERQRRVETAVLDLLAA